MFGSYAIPGVIEYKGTRIEIKTSEKKIYYQRFSDGVLAKEKVIIGTKKKISITPVEPLELPKEISTHFLVELKQAITLEPHVQQEIFLTFPIEIGVFIQDQGSGGIIDVFSNNSQKYTLYGDPRQGVLCRYWKSDVYFEEPELDYFDLGIIKLKLKNDTAYWTTITNCVFSGYGIKIFYNNKKAIFEAQMKVIDNGIAEVEVSNKTNEKKMIKAQEIMTKKLAIGLNRFVMLEGI